MSTRKSKRLEKMTPRTSERLSKKKAESTKPKLAKVEEADSKDGEHTIRKKIEFPEIHSGKMSSKKKKNTEKISAPSKPKRGRRQKVSSVSSEEKDNHNENLDAVKGDEQWHKVNDEKSNEVVDNHDERSANQIDDSDEEDREEQEDANEEVMEEQINDHAGNVAVEGNSNISNEHSAQDNESNDFESFVNEKSHEHVDDSDGSLAKQIDESDEEDGKVEEVTNEEFIEKKNKYNADNVVMEKSSISNDHSIQNSEPDVAAKAVIRDNDGSKEAGVICNNLKIRTGTDDSPTPIDQNLENKEQSNEDNDEMSEDNESDDDAPIGMSIHESKKQIAEKEKLQRESLIAMKESKKKLQIEREQRNKEQQSEKKIHQKWMIPDKLDESILKLADKEIFNTPNLNVARTKKESKNYKEENDEGFSEPTSKHAKIDTKEKVDIKTIQKSIKMNSAHKFLKSHFFGGRLERQQLHTPFNDKSKFTKLTNSETKAKKRKKLLPKQGLKHDL